MLELAYLHKEELQKLYAKVVTLDVNKFLFFGEYNNYTLIIDDNNFNKVQLVSVYNDIIIGYFEASVDRTSNDVTSITMVNLQNNYHNIFAIDVIRFYKLLKKFRKISFMVAVGNPLEKHYDKIGPKLGWDVIGIKRAHVMLSDRKFYDLKMYEIFNKQK
jgi:hypothetical protein